MLPCSGSGIDQRLDFSNYQQRKWSQTFIRIFPSITTSTIKHFLGPPIEGVVLQVETIPAELASWQTRCLFCWDPLNNSKFWNTVWWLINQSVQCYGAGNIPSNRQDVIDIIAEATARQFKIKTSCIILYTSAKFTKNTAQGSDYPLCDPM